MCWNGLLFPFLVCSVGLWTVDCSKDGCPVVVQSSHHFTKVHSGTCYLFVDQERYWEDARDSCRRLGGEMLSVEDSGTMSFIRSVLDSGVLGWNKRGVWLGARFSDGAWRWTSGKTMGYTNWATGEPSKFLGLFSLEDCALMRSRDSWRWHDYTCGSMKYHFNYICQFPTKNTTMTTTTTTASSSSTTTFAAVHKPGYFSINGHFSDRKDNQLDRSLQQDMGQEGGTLDQAGNGQSPRPYDGHGGVQGYPYDSRHPASFDQGYNVHSASQVLNNTNLTILTIILVTGGIVLLILLLIFLIIRKRYNYKKAMGRPATVHFENRNYTHAHNSSSDHHSASTTTPLPPPPAPHTFHHVPVPPTPPPRPLIPPRPLVPNAPPHGVEAVLPVPHVLVPYLPHSLPASDLYLTPMEITGGPGLQGSDEYEEIQTATYACTSNLTNNPGRSLNTVHVTSGGGGKRCVLRHEDSATIPLISATGCPWTQSDDSLNDPMTSSLTMKTSSIHNDYVDMNGSPVVPARSYRPEEASTSKASEGNTSGLGGEVSALVDADPKSEMTTDSGSDVMQGGGKQPVQSMYSNLMTTSQERCENLYAQLH